MHVRQDKLNRRLVNASNKIKRTFLDLSVSGPNVVEVHWLSVLADADGILHQVHGHAAGKRVGYNQRRRREVVGLHQGMDAALEVAVS